MDRIIMRIQQVIEYLLMFSLLMMVLINFVDVSGRHLFNHPIFGIPTTNVDNVNFMNFGETGGGRRVISMGLRVRF